MSTCEVERKTSDSFAESSAAFFTIPDPSPPSANPERIITEATFALRIGDAQEITQRVFSHTQDRVTQQDIGEKSAGCMFKNPVGKHAGQLIDEAGLKGFAIGGARVSLKHANFVVNDGTATARDVRAVVEHVKEKIYQFLETK